MKKKIKVNNSVFEKMFAQPTFDFKKQKEIFIANLHKLKAMTVQEQTFYKKWLEVQEYKSKYDMSRFVKANIWKPSDIMNKETTIAELDALYPEIIPVKTDTELVHWTMLRIFSHSMPYTISPGRFLRFFVQDKHTGKYLGIVSLASDVTSIASRDKYIGWNKENKFEEGKLNHTAIGNCIMATQPFGYNFLGGKLVASMLITDKVRTEWLTKYGTVLAGLTTTSLYGTNSMYNGIPYWKKLGASKGLIYIKPDEKLYKMWFDYLKDTKPDEVNKMLFADNKTGIRTSPKQNIINMIFKTLGIKQSDFFHGYQRGVYSAMLYENSREFLRSEIPEDQLVMKKKVERNVDGIIDYWKPKAKNRYLKLYSENRLNPEVTYYNDLIDVTWKDAYLMYKNVVGR